MKSEISLIVLLIIVSACSLNAQVRHEKYALLVGVTKYEDANMNRNPLKFPEDDAKALKVLLQRSGYHVDLLVGKSATQKAILRSLENAQKQGKEDGVVLIGFFGHGTQYDKTAYFCPYDTAQQFLKDTRGNIIRNKNGSPKQEPDPKKLVSMRTMLDALSACGAKNRVLLADCCRDDPNRARGRTAFGSSLSTKDLPPGTAAFFACQKGEQAYEHDEWNHGAFTFAFLKHANELATSGLVTSGTLSDKIYDTVRRIVKEKTGKPQQTVYCLNSGRVNFMLKPTAADKMVGPAKNTEPKKARGGALPKTLDVYQIEHAGAGAELIRKPDYRLYQGNVLKVPRIVKGSEVVAEEFSDDESGGPLKWARIRVLNGPSEGKTGWTMTRNLKLTGKKINLKDVKGMPSADGPPIKKAAKAFRDFLRPFGETPAGWTEKELTNQSFVIEKNEFLAAGDFILKFTVDSWDRNAKIGLKLKGKKTDDIDFQLDHDQGYNWNYYLSGKSPSKPEMVPFHRKQSTHYVIKRGRMIKLQTEQTTDSTRGFSPVFCNVVVAEDAAYEGLTVSFLSKKIEITDISLHPLSKSDQPRKFTTLNNKIQSTGAETPGWSARPSKNLLFAIEKEGLSIHGDFAVEFEILTKKQGARFLLKLVGKNCLDVAVGGYLQSPFSDGANWNYRTPEKLDIAKPVAHDRNRYILKKKDSVMTLEAVNSIRSENREISKFVIDKNSEFHAIQLIPFSKDIHFGSISVKKN